MCRKNFLIIVTAVVITISQSSAQTFNAVCVGIEDYPGTSMDMNFAKDDAEDIRFRLINDLDWDADDIELLTDNEASRTAIVTALNGMNQGSGNTCLFTFSGHGISYELDRWAGWEGIYTYDSNYFTPTELLSKFESGYDQFAVMIDACGSGVFADDMDRGVILSACTTSQPSAERRNNHGTFTSFVLDAMEDMTGDSNSDGDFTAQEIFAYAEPRVIKYIEDIKWK